jgi:hypothetical protein
VTIDTVVSPNVLISAPTDDFISASELNFGITWSARVERSASGVPSIVKVKWGDTAERTLNVNEQTDAWVTFYSAADLANEVNKVSAFTVTTTDWAGNVSSVTRAMTIDTIVPSTPVVTGMSNDFGTFGDFGTDRERVFITGTAEPNTTIRMTLGGKPYDAVVDSLGLWVSPEINLKNVNRNTTALEMTFAAVDAAGNVSPSTSPKTSVSRVGLVAPQFNLGTMNVSKGLTISGARSEDRMTGFTTGDINGDGINDLILSSASATVAPGVVSGAVTVLYGKTSWAGVADVDLLNMGVNNGWVLQGADLNGGLGSGVGFIGDLNGDNYGELIAGASGASNGSINQAGAAYIIWGSNNPLGVSGGSNRMVLNTNAVTPSQGFVFRGLTAVEQLGNATLGISTKFEKDSATTTKNLNSDFNGDGLADFFIAASAFDRVASGTTQTAAADVGAVIVVFGRSDRAYGTINSSTNQREMTINDLTADKGFIIRGAAEFDNAGSSIASAGDVNGDGMTDLLIGAPNVNRDGFITAGAAYVIYGKKTPTGGTSWSGLTDDPTMAGRKILDLATLKSSDGFIIQGESEAGSPPRTGSALGNSVEGLGDINGDGYADIGIGASAASPDNNGKAYVIFGSASGQGAKDANDRQVLDVATMLPSQGFILQGSAGWLGTSVGAAGDVNRDGLADFIVSAPYLTNAGRTSTGVSYVIYGKEKGVAFSNIVGTGAQSTQSILSLATNIFGPADGYSISGRSDGEQLGNPNGDSSIIAPGDLNNDGWDDLFINSFQGDSQARTNNGQALFLYSNAINSAGGLGNYSSTSGQTINGSDGRDDLYGAGSGAVVRGFAGNDLIYLDPGLGFALLDGGTGIDTLRMVNGATMNFDLSKIPAGRIRDIEVIDLVVFSGSNSNTLTVTQQSLIDLSSTTDILKVLGNSADTVKAAGFTVGSFKFENGILFSTYKNGAAELWVQEGVVVDITTPPPPAAVVPQAFSWAEHAVLAA